MQEYEVLSLDSRRHRSSARRRDAKTRCRRRAAAGHWLSKGPRLIAPTRRDAPNRQGAVLHFRRIPR